MSEPSERPSSTTRRGTVKLAKIGLVVALAFGVSACREADIASSNVSAAADSFEVLRRIVFYNGITGEYMLVIEGYCSLGNADEPGELTVTCKTGVDQYKKDFLGLSDNVTYFLEQLDAVNVDPNHYRVIFKPASILPNINLQ